jgi:hypothetical protein
MTEIEYLLIDDPSPNTTYRETFTPTTDVRTILRHVAARHDLPALDTFAVNEKTPLAITAQTLQSIHHPENVYPMKPCPLIVNITGFEESSSLTVPFPRLSMTVGEVLTLSSSRLLTGLVAINDKPAKLSDRFCDIAPLTGPVKVIVSPAPEATDFVIVTGRGFETRPGEPGSDFRLDIIASMEDAGLSGFPGIVYEFDAQGLPPGRGARSTTVYVIGSHRRQEVTSRSTTSGSSTRPRSRPRACATSPRTCGLSGRISSTSRSVGGAPAGSSRSSGAQSTLRRSASRSTGSRRGIRSRTWTWRL